MDGHVRRRRQCIGERSRRPLRVQTILPSPPVPAGNGGPAASAATVGSYLLGTFAGLIALAVVATMFMTAEYRRNLIRVTLAASPRRGRALAAKAVVIGAVAFVTGLAGAGIAVLAGTAVTHARGTYQFPVTGLTEARLIIATGVLAAVSAVFALAVGSMVRRGAVAVTIVIVTVVLPYFLSPRWCRPARRTGCCGSPPRRASPSRRRTHGIRRSAFSTR